MNTIKQSRYLWFTIILLVIMNLVTLGLLWFGKQTKGGPRDGHPDSAAETERIEQLLKQELGFDDQQTQLYAAMREEHHQAEKQLRKEIHILKQQMFDEVLQDAPRPMLSDSLLHLIQEKQSEMEHLTYNHFMDLRRLCKPEQREKLKLLMQEVFRKTAPRREGAMPPPNGRRPPPDGNRPPPPGERPPPPPNNQ